MKSICLFTALLTLGVVSILPAQGIEVRGLGGWAWSTTDVTVPGIPDVDDLQNVYSGALGGVATIGIPLGRRTISVGPVALYHFGEELRVEATNRVDEAEIGTLFLGGELGVTWLTAPLLVRIMGDFGVSRIRQDVTLGGVETSDTESKFAAAPGLLLALPVGRMAYVGLDTKYWIVDGAFPEGVALYGTVGIKLRR